MTDKSTPADTGSDTATLERDEPETAGTAASEAASPTARTQFTDRLWGWKAMLAVALAAVILGGLAGAGLSHLAGGSGRDGRFGPGGFGGRGGPGMGQGPGQGFPGQQGQNNQNGQQGQNNQNGQQGQGFGPQNGQNN